MHRGSLAPGDWIQLNGPFNLLNISSVTFRVADTPTRTAGSPLAAIEVHQDTLTGPIVQTYNLVSTGNTTTWTSQTFPISLSGTHELFLVFRAVTGGQPATTCSTSTGPSSSAPASAPNPAQQPTGGVARCARRPLVYFEPRTAGEREGNET